MAAKMKHLARAYLLSGAADLTVLPNHTWEMNEFLIEAGVPVTTYTITSSTAGYETWWPTHFKTDAPVAPAGHDHSSFALAERIIVDIIRGQAPDYGEHPVHHLWDPTLGQVS
jgi:hypothetical protein